MEYIPKLIVIFIFFLLFLLFRYRTKSFFLSSIYTLLIVLPFNITAQIFQNISDPYVNGIFTNYLQPYIHIIDIFIGLLLISAIFEKKVILKHLKRFLVPTLLLLIYGGLQSIITQDIVVLINVLRIFFYLISFKVIAINFKSIKWSNLFIYTLSLTILFQIVLGVIQFSNGASLGLPFLGESQVVNGMRGSSFVSLKGTDYLRGYGTFPHPNVFGGWLLAMLFFFDYLLRKKYLKKYIFYILQTIILIGLAITFSRTAWICTVIFLIYFVFRNVKRFSFNAFIPIFLERLHISGTGFDERLILLKKSWEIFKQNFVFGTGLGKFVDSFGEELPRTVNGIPLIEPVHNVVVLMLCELGLVGSGLLIWSWLSIIKEYLFDWKRNRILKISLLLCLLLISFIDHYFFTLPQGLLLEGLFLLMFIS